MKRAIMALALAITVLMAGCASKAKPTPPTPTTPAVPTTVGVTRYAQGPGLVVEGYTPLKKIVVELHGAAAFLTEEVTPKDDGWYRVTWADTDGYAEIIVKDEAGKVLVKGSRPSEINVGLFNGGNASGVRVDVVDPKAMTTLMVGGQVKTTDGKIWLELRDGNKVLATHQWNLTDQHGGFSGKVPMAPGARTVWILTNNGKQAEVGVPIVTH
ncbi:MAG TPA: hypothetical protein VNT75_23930 [Symbiobacteriaceae bacterium]|nr:hypothetical protein [Symbiobacteriaceae bacterium]